MGNYFHMPVGFGGITGPAASAQVHITPRTAELAALCIGPCDGATQTGNLVEIFDVSGNKDVRITAAGDVIAGGSVNAIYFKGASASTFADTLTVQGTITGAGSIIAADLAISSDMTMAGSVRSKFYILNDLRLGSSCDFYMDTTTTPSASGAAGSRGQIGRDSNYLYVHDGTAWGRIALDYAF